MLMKPICSLFSKSLLSEIILNNTFKVKTHQKVKVNKLLSEMVQVVIKILYFEMGNRIESITPYC